MYLLVHLASSFDLHPNLIKFLLVASSAPQNQNTVRRNVFLLETFRFSMIRIFFLLFENLV